MIRRFAAILCSITGAAVLLVGVGAGPAEAKQSGVFAGRWSSVDTDGSHQTLRITGSGNGSYGMVLYDDAASVCGGAPTLFVGSGHVDGDELVMAGALACQPGGNVLHGVVQIGYSYDAGSDTLTDFFGVTWTRLG
jgi:hypothetical protein